MAAAVSFQVVDAGSRRVVTVSPAGRPDLRLPMAHPKRGERPGSTSRVALCVASRPAPRSPWLVAKMALIGALTVVGGAVCVGQFVANATPDPAFEYVAGDPGWAHVTQP